MCRSVSGSPSMRASMRSAIRSSCGAGSARRASTWSRKYSSSSRLAVRSTSVSVGPIWRMRITQSMNRSSSSNGTPSIVAMTRTGMCRA